MAIPTAGSVPDSNRGLPPDNSTSTAGAIDRRVDLAAAHAAPALLAVRDLLLVLLAFSSGTYEAI
ncbi:MAG TPA: hypothetical protein VGH72_11015, partial [Pseudonocardia sp.]